MEAHEIALLVVVTLVILGGGGVIAYRELVTHPERRLVSRPRDTIEVLLPLAGLVLLLAAIWLTVAD